ncbi:hypothetical protein C8F04DRAFT_1137273 [Mycena alexandri]|uniref:Uncharacterized protein n=1 Tax=Mycena alexandri TaxID=1745969 RepID=A0AAD6S9W9_9AGAR|nr:hypothetical protein C8F04DRAFT_1137273 [Mycena alexandri]
MLATFKIWAILALAASYVSALTISSITGNAVSGGSLTIDWNTATTDESGTFSIELNHPSFNSALALATNVDSSQLSITIPLPTLLPSDGFTITFVDISDINNVFSTSQSFSIGPESTTESVSIKASSVASHKSSSTISVGAASSSQSSNPLSTKPLPSTSNTGFGTTASAPSAASQSGSSVGSSAAPSTPTGAATAPRSSLFGALLVVVGVVASAFAL